MSYNPSQEKDTKASLLQCLFTVSIDILFDLNQSLLKIALCRSLAMQ